VIRARAAKLALLTLALLGAFASPAAATPQIKHVFIVVLENKDFDNTFSPSSPATYLNNTLKPNGAFVPEYYGIGHQSLTNYIAMVSGQAPSPQTQADCQAYDNFLPGEPAPPGMWTGQVIGQGCIFPNGGPGLSTVQSVANQLEDSGYTWKGYMEDMETGTSASPAPGPCRHPGVNSQDNTQSAEVGDQYATRHNPFMYFHSLIDFPTCALNVVDLIHLATDLQSESTTPNYAFITPNLCNDGHDGPCVDGQPGGLTSANQWLQNNIPAILGSPAYQDHGLLIVTFDEAEVDTPTATGDFSACCGEIPGPNSPSPGGVGGGPTSGGGHVGAVMLSPCITPGTTTDTAYNHYSLLRSVEDFFDLPHLGFAGQDGLVPFGDDILTKADCGAAPSEADLSVTKDDSDDPVTQGQQFTYTLAAKNNGPDDAQGVQVTDTLPADVTYDSSSASQGSCSEAGGTVTCDFGGLPDQEVATAAITVTPTAAGLLSNTATVSSDVDDPTPDNDSDTETTVVSSPPPGSADLSISKTDSADPVQANQTFYYTLAVHNNGPDTAQSVRVTDALPAPLDFDSAPGCSQASGTVTCDLGNLASGGDATVTITVTLARAGQLSNTANVSAATTDLDGSNNSDTETTQVSSPGGGGGAASASGSTMRLKVKPRRAHTGKRVRFRLRVFSSDPNCIGGVVIRFGHKSRVTRSSGKARRIRRTFSRPKKRFAYASKPGCGTAKARVKVKPG
jgi:phosphatidylinositol-3-phosphatase